MNNVKPFSELSARAQRVIRSDPRQSSLFGSKHERELQNLRKKKKKSQSMTRSWAISTSVTLTQRT